MSQAYVPERGDIIWLDLEPVKGKEIGKMRPVIVLSHKKYNQATSMIICSPISTSIRGLAIEVPVDNLDKPSVVVASIIQTLSWKARRSKLITKSESHVMEEIFKRLLPLIGVA